MIAGASGNLKRAVLLASVTCVAYGAFEFGSYMLFQTQGTEQLGTILLRDRKSTRLNSSHGSISYAVFCLKKKKTIKEQIHISRIRKRILTRCIDKKWHSQ